MNPSRRWFIAGAGGVLALASAEICATRTAPERARDFTLLDAEYRRRADSDAQIDTLYAFVRAMWSAAEPGRPYLDNWHIRVVCEALEAVVRGETQSLVLCQPPRSMKSYLVNVFLPAWIWLQHPEYQFLCVSNSDDLSIRDSMRMRRVVTSPGYRALVERQAQRGGPAVWGISKEQFSKVNFQNDRGGGRECYGIRANITGKGCDFLLLDDLYDAKEVLLGDPARVAERMASVVAVHDGALLSRFNPGGPKASICIMQRLHEGDIAGVLTARGVPSLMLPMEYEPGPTADPRDVRSEAGEVLVPPEWLPQPLDVWKTALGAQASGQLQQRPTAATGGVLPREHWRFVDLRHFPADDDYDVTWQAWDLAFGGKSSSDYCVGIVVGLLGARFYMRDREKGRWEFPEQIKAIRRLSERHPSAFGIAIEDAANGRAARETITTGLDGDDSVPGIVLVRAKEDKVARAQSWSPILEAGNMIAPCLCGRADVHEHGPTERHLVVPWAEDVITVCGAFPKGAHDDDVDALGHGVRQAARGGKIAAA